MGALPGFLEGLANATRVRGPYKVSEKALALHSEVLCAHDRWIANASSGRSTMSGLTRWPSCVASCCRSTSGGWARGSSSQRGWLRVFEQMPARLARLLEHDRVGVILGQDRRGSWVVPVRVEQEGTNVVR